MVYISPNVPSTDQLYMTKSTGKYSEKYTRLVSFIELCQGKYWVTTIASLPNFVLTAHLDILAPRRLSLSQWNNPKLYG